MYKLKFKSEEVIEILDGSSENAILVGTTLSELSSVCGKFTDDNLSAYAVYDSEDNIKAIYRNKTMTNRVECCEMELNGAKTLVATITLKDIDVILQRMLVVENAIADLGKTINGGV